MFPVTGSTYYFQMKTEILANFQLCNIVPLRNLQTSQANNSKIFRIQNAKFSGCCFHMNTKTQGDFQICISIPLNQSIGVLKMVFPLTLSNFPSNWSYRISPNRYIYLLATASRAFNSVIFFFTSCKVSSPLLSDSHHLMEAGPCFK